MIKLIQDIDTVGPLLFIAILMMAATYAIWLIIELKSESRHQHDHSENNIWFLKRNAARLRKMRYH